MPKNAPWYSKSSSYLGPKIWNLILPELKQLSCFISFKKAEKGLRNSILEKRLCKLCCLLR